MSQEQIREREECRWCGMKFSLASDRISHELCHLDPLPKRAPPCNICGRRDHDESAHYKPGNCGRCGHPEADHEKEDDTAYCMGAYRCRCHEVQPPL